MKKLLPLLLLLVVFNGCVGSRMSELSTPTPEMSYDEEYLDQDGRYLEEKSIVISESTTAVDSEKVIKTGTLSLHMEDVREGTEEIKLKAEEWGGDVLSSTLNRYDNAYYAYITIRVPSDQFDSSMTGLKEMALYTVSENTNAEDVTEVYMDLEARLTNLKEEEQQYLEILNKAETVDEILQVTDYLSTVRYEIESVETQLQYYDTNVDYSTISLTLTEDESVEAVKETWRPISTIKEAFSDWFIFLQDVADFGIYVLIFGWPVLLILILVWIFRRGTRRRK